MTRHWPEYLIEAVGLGLFMLSASTFGVLLFHPASVVVEAFPSPLFRRACMGLAMALTNVALIYSPWGKQSGAHFNPAVTLTFLRLGKVAGRDAVGYLVAQFVGGAIGMFLATLIWGQRLEHPAVNFLVTQPGLNGAAVAWIAEFTMGCLLFSVVLRVSREPRWARYTGWVAALLVGAFITWESPLSGMSLNPARTWASALAAGQWNGWWIYFSAPLAGMWVAAEVVIRSGSSPRIACAKMHHQNARRCIFCEFQSQRRTTSTVRLSSVVPLNRV